MTEPPHQDEAALPAAAPFPQLRFFGRRMTGGKLLPLLGVSGPMPLVTAIMVALTVIAAAGGLALHNVAAVSSAQLSTGLTVQIIEAAPGARMRQAAAAVSMLRSMTGVGAVRLVPQSKVEALVEPWLGHQDSSHEDATIPIPALIDAQLIGDITPQRLAGIADRLHRVAPAARSDAQAGWLQPVLGAIASLQWLAAALVVLLAGAMAAVVVLAARTALGHHRATIEIVHMLGGSDAQVAGVVQRAIGIDAAVGGALGLAMAVPVIVVLGTQFASLDAGFVSGGGLRLADWLMLALIPGASAALAVLTARLSVLSSLRTML